MSTDIGLDRNLDEEFKISRELKLKYLERRAGDLKVLSASLSLSRYNDMLMIAEKIAASAGSFEFPELERLAVEMIRASSNRDSRALIGCVEKLVTWHEVTRSRI